MFSFEFPLNFPPSCPDYHHTVNPNTISVKEQGKFVCCSGGSLQTTPCPWGGGGGVLRFSSDRDMTKGFLGVGKFGKYFFLWFYLSGDLSWDFLGICGSARVSRPHSSVNKLQPNLF